MMSLLQILLGLGLVVIAYQGHERGAVRAGTGPLRPYTASRDTNPVAFHFFIVLYICSGLAMIVWGVFSLVGLVDPMPVS